MKRGVSDKTPHRWFTPNLRSRTVGNFLTYCWRCGLVALKNDATARAVRAGCFKEQDVVLDVTG